jgi:hypothetical protein
MNSYEWLCYASKRNTLCFTVNYVPYRISEVVTRKQLATVIDIFKHCNNVM